MERGQFSVGGCGTELQFLLHVGVFAFAPVKRGHIHMEVGSGAFALECGVQCRAGFLDPV